MTQLTARVTEVLHRHPGAAITAEELSAQLTDFAPPDRVREIRTDALSGEAAPVRFIDPPKRRWSANLSPISWVIGSRRRPPADLPTRSLPVRLRGSLRSLSGAVDPSSALAWARWSRMLQEEPELRRALARRHEDPAFIPTE